MQARRLAVLLALQIKRKTSVDRPLAAPIRLVGLKPLPSPTESSMPIIILTNTKINTNTNIQNALAPAPQ